MLIRISTGWYFDLFMGCENLRLFALRICQGDCQGQGLPFQGKTMVLKVSRVHPELWLIEELLLIQLLFLLLLLLL